jgi:hypothetical protein
MDGAGKPVCLGGGESAAAGRVLLSAHGGKAFFAAGGNSFRQGCDGIFAHTAAGANCSEGAYPLRQGREKQRRHLRRTAKRNRNVAGKAQRRGRVLLLPYGGKAFLRRAGIPFGKAAMGFSLTLRRGGESVRQAVLCGSPNSARRAGAAVYAPKPQKRQRENKNPPLRGTVVRN